jgi:KUP system potassium uptake protein
VQVPEVVEHLVALEQRSGADPERIAEIVATIRQCAGSATTHIVPHYHVVSKRIEAGGPVLNGPLNWMRKMLIENNYRHLAAMFPETKNWLSSADE